MKVCFVRPQLLPGILLTASTLLFSSMSWAGKGSITLSVPQDVTQESITSDLETITYQEYKRYLHDIHGASRTEGEGSDRKGSRGNSTFHGPRQDEEPSPFEKKDAALIHLEDEGDAYLGHGDQVPEFEIGYAGLEDYTHLPFITIDNDTSKDLDQAMYIEKDAAKSQYTVYYAIADGDFFLKQAEELDRAAQIRIFTTYLPFSNHPVLPRSLSEGLASLNPGEKRRANLIVMTFDQDGKKIDAHFHRAVILSQKQLSYRLVQEYYDGKNPELKDFMKQEPSSPQVKRVADLLKELGEKLYVNAKDRGQIYFEDQELDFALENGKLTVTKKEARMVERFNEQVSIMANSAVAQYLAEAGIQSIHRVHPKPIQAKAEALEKSLQEIFTNVPPHETSLDLANLLKKDYGSPEKNQVMHDLIMGSLSQAQYTTDSEDLEHFGLGLKYYDHFTAPMRRYPDIAVARILSAVIQNEKEVPYQSAETGIETLVKNVNRAAQREASIFKRLQDYIVAVGMQSKVGETLQGRIRYFDKRHKVIKVAIEGMPFTVPVNTTSVFAEAKKVFFNDHSVDVSGFRDQKKLTFRMGDLVELKIVKIQPAALLTENVRDGIGAIVIEPKVVAKIGKIQEPK